VARENAESDGNVGFEKEIDGQPDCKILRVERASRGDPEHKQVDRGREIGTSSVRINM
jgi:hypothetical protein